MHPTKFKNRTLQSLAVTLGVLCLATTAAAQYHPQQPYGHGPQYGHSGYQHAPIVPMPRLRVAPVLPVVPVLPRQQNYANYSSQQLFAESVSIARRVEVNIQEVVQITQGNNGYGYGDTLSSAYVEMQSYYQSEELRSNTYFSVSGEIQTHLTSFGQSSFMRVINSRRNSCQFSQSVISGLSALDLINLEIRSRIQAQTLYPAVGGGYVAPRYPVPQPGYNGYNRGPAQIPALYRDPRSDYAPRGPRRDYRQPRSCPLSNPSRY